MAQARLHGTRGRRDAPSGRPSASTSPTSPSSSTADEARLVGHLGPDPLSDEWDPDEAARRLSADTRPIHVAIQDQRNVAGFGNEYANEILFVRGILPTTPANETDAAALVDLGARMIRVNRDRVDRTFTGDGRRGQTTWVYRREGRPCRRCGTLIRGGSLGADPTRRAHRLLVPDLPDRAVLRHDRGRAGQGVRAHAGSRHPRLARGRAAARMEAHRATGKWYPWARPSSNDSGRQHPSSVRVSSARARACSGSTTFPPAPARPRLTGAVTADLAIVGAGYTGLWTALLAKRRDPGARVVVVEARTVGWAASGRNGGFCEASLTHGRDNGLTRWPDEIDQLDRLGMANLDGMGEDIAAHRIDADWERNGTLAVATEPHQLAWLDEWATDAAARGDEGVERLSAAGGAGFGRIPDLPRRACGRSTRRRSSILASSPPDSRARPRRRGSRSSRARPCAGSRRMAPPSCSPAAADG